LGKGEKKGKGEGGERKELPSRSSKSIFSFKIDRLLPRPLPTAKKGGKKGKRGGKKGKKEVGVPASFAAGTEIVKYRKASRGEGGEGGKPEFLQRKERERKPEP